MRGKAGGGGLTGPWAGPSVLDYPVAITRTGVGIGKSAQFVSAVGTSSSTTVSTSEAVYVMAPKRRTHLPWLGSCRAVFSHNLEPPIPPPLGAQIQANSHLPTTTTRVELRRRILWRWARSSRVLRSLFARPQAWDVLLGWVLNSVIACIDSSNHTLLNGIACMRSRLRPQWRDVKKDSIEALRKRVDAPWPLPVCATYVVT